MRWVPLNENRLAAKPSGEIEELMQFGDFPVVDTAHLDIVEDIVNNMDERLADVIRAIFYEQVPFSELGERLGCSKTQAWRRTNQAIEELRSLLLTNTTLAKRYNMDSWQSAARAAIDSLDSGTAVPADHNLIDFCIRELRAAVLEQRELPSWGFSQIGIEAIREMRLANLWHPDAFHRMLCGKQHDYGHNNILAFGLIGVAVRLSDKIARLRNLTAKGGKHMSEPLLDTWLDMAGYAVIAEMIFNNTFTLELEEAA